MGGGGKKSFHPYDLAKGGVLQCTEAITFGMPFEVWKTYMGANRQEGTLQAFQSVYKNGGVRAFWRGWEAKMVESFLKGGILLFAKEGIIRSTQSFGLGELTSGLVGGFGGGVTQVVVIAPCSYIISAAVVGAKEGKKMSTMERVKMTYKQNGVGGFYKGSVPLMARQGSNWASRQGITDYVRRSIRNWKAGSNGGVEKGLSVGEEAMAGVIGGCLSTWNQPFEVMRIDAQARAARGEASQGMVKTAGVIMKESGPAGFFVGVIPRMGLCVAQTLFMVTLPYILKEYGL